ncbi:hypothetical protein [Sedimentibacter sp. LTW-03]|uniref:hypothetical protein n=1 Tax=Sedimentibacter sp. LTW-03 TaxID=3453406 RepID=UPI003F86F4C6
MTEKEALLLDMFRRLNRYEQNIIIGKISELILNGRRKKINFFEGEQVKYIPVVFVFVL